jgi:hypothetical protein
MHRSVKKYGQNLTLPYRAIWNSMERKKLFNGLDFAGLLTRIFFLTGTKKFSYWEKYFF